MLRCGGGTYTRSVCCWLNFSIPRWLVRAALHTPGSQLSFFFCVSVAPSSSRRSLWCECGWRDSVKVGLENAVLGFADGTQMWKKETGGLLKVCSLPPPLYLLPPSNVRHASDPPAWHQSPVTLILLLYRSPVLAEVYDTGFCALPSALCDHQLLVSTSTSVTFSLLSPIFFLFSTRQINADFSAGIRLKCLF